MPEFETCEDVSWDVVSSVKASKRRLQVLHALAEKPMLNGEIADELDISTRWARRQVKWLEEHGLVENLTETKYNYKLYAATDAGQQVVEVL